MKKFILIAFAASMLIASPGYAGFIMKKQAAPVAAVTQSANNETPVVSTEVAANEPSAEVAKPAEAVKKQSFFSKMFHKKGGSAEISKALYVVLAIIGFGWLGMGINDNFEDWDWVLSLVLYIIFYLPGLIYTLVKMKKYYK